jgi:Flp pilus assembly protein protease CpaA
MQALATILSAAALIAVAVQDFRHRLISWYLVPVLFLLFAWNSLCSLSLSEAAFYFVINLSFIIIQVLALTLYFSIKERRPVNIIDSRLGIGDILLFVALCAAFSPVNFIVFYLLSLVLTIAGYTVSIFLLKGRSGSIPLAGAVALVLLLCLSYHFFAPIDFYNDTAALGLLNMHDE